MEIMVIYLLSPKVSDIIEIISVRLISMFIPNGGKKRVILEMRIWGYFPDSHFGDGDFDYFLQIPKIPLFPLFID